MYFHQSGLEPTARVTRRGSGIPAVSPTVGEIISKSSAHLPLSVWVAPSVSTAAASATTTTPTLLVSTFYAVIVATAPVPNIC